MDRALEGNRLIAEFCEHKLSYVGNPLYGIGDGIYLTLMCSPANLKYHLSFNMLIPAVRKFLEIPSDTFNYDVGKMTELKTLQTIIAKLPITTEIGNLWNELVAAIKWYNGAIDSHAKFLKNKEKKP